MKSVLNRYSLVLPMAFLFSLAAAAAEGKEGTHTGGGGDTKTELRMSEIRSDIFKWIGEGGAQDLKLPSNVTLENYVSGMEKVLVPHAVVIGAVTLAEELATENDELKVLVSGQPKACRGFVSLTDGLPHILCNVERFAATSEAAQYRLLHHEYASLAGLEENIGASSDYEISKQITGYLEPEIVLKLAVKKLDQKKSIPVTCESGCTTADFVGSYTLSKDEAQNCQSTLEIQLQEFKDGLKARISGGYWYGVDHKLEFLNTGGACSVNRDGICTTGKGYTYVDYEKNSIQLVKKTRYAVWIFNLIPVDPNIFGTTEYEKIELRPTSDGTGALQVVNWNQNSVTGKLFVAESCRYNRVGK